MGRWAVRGIARLGSAEKLLVADIDEARAQQVADEVGGPCTALRLDATDSAALQEAFTNCDVVLNTMHQGMVLPMSTMPGEAVEHTYAGPMAAETIHFLEAVAFDRPVLVTPEHARMVMEVYVAADLSAERNEPVALPLTEAKKVRAVA